MVKPVVPRTGAITDQNSGVAPNTKAKQSATTNPKGIVQVISDKKYQETVNKLAEYGAVSRDLEKSKTALEETKAKISSSQEKIKKADEATVKLVKALLLKTGKSAEELSRDPKMLKMPNHEKLIEIARQLEAQS